MVIGGKGHVKVGCEFTRRTNEPNSSPFVRRDVLDAIRYIKVLAEVFCPVEVSSNTSLV